MRGTLQPGLFACVRSNWVFLTQTVGSTHLPVSWSKLQRTEGPFHHQGSSRRAKWRWVSGYALVLYLPSCVQGGSPEVREVGYKKYAVWVIRRDPRRRYAAAVARKGARSWAWTRIRAGGQKGL